MWGRVKAALKENLLFAGVAIVVVGVLYAVLKFGFPQSASGIIEAAITAGSMWGIFVLIGLLSYGLIFVPRKYWRKYVPILFEFSHLSELTLNNRFNIFNQNWLATTMSLKIMGTLSTKHSR